MCVARVLHWQPNAGATVNSQILAEVSQCVESINGVKEGRWKDILSFYKPMLKGISLLNKHLFLSGFVKKIGFLGRFNHLILFFGIIVVFGLALVQFS